MPIKVQNYIFFMTSTNNIGFYWNHALMSDY
jgi:hypothetical protein